MKVLEAVPPFLPTRPQRFYSPPAHPAVAPRPESWQWCSWILIATECERLPHTQLCVAYRGDVSVLISMSLVNVIPGETRHKRPVTVLPEHLLRAQTVPQKAAAARNLMAHLLPPSVESFHMGELSSFALCWFPYRTHLWGNCPQGKEPAAQHQEAAAWQSSLGRDRSQNLQVPGRSGRGSGPGED